jgi:hypothetical protein
MKSCPFPDNFIGHYQWADASGIFLGHPDWGTGAANGPIPLLLFIMLNLVALILGITVGFLYEWFQGVLDLNGNA